VQQPHLPYSYQSAASSSASIQSSQYTNTSSHYAPWDTPDSSTSTFNNPHGQGEAQGRRWASGGYDGEGYG
jgi:hypothetical protein